MFAAPHHGVMTTFRRTDERAPVTDLLSVDELVAAWDAAASVTPDASMAPDPLRWADAHRFGVLVPDQIDRWPAPCRGGRAGARDGAVSPREHPPTSRAPTRGLPPA